MLRLLAPCADQVERGRAGVDKELLERVRVVCGGVLARKGERCGSARDERHGRRGVPGGDECGVVHEVDMGRLPAEEQALADTRGNEGLYSGGGLGFEAQLRGGEVAKALARGQQGCAGDNHGRELLENYRKWVDDAILRCDAAPSLDVPNVSPCLV